MVRIKTNKDNKIFAYYREKEENRVVVFINLTKKIVTFKPVLIDIDGEYTEYFTQEKISVPQVANLDLVPWGYKVFVK